MVITGLTRNQLGSNLSGVRIPPSPPRTQNCYLIISNLPQISPLHALVLTIRILLMALSTVSGEALECEEMIMWGIKRKFSKLRRFNLYILFLHMIPQIIGKTSRNFSYHSYHLHIYFYTSAIL